MKTAVITIKPGTKLQIPDGRIVGAMLKSDGSCELTVETILAREVPKDDSFVLIEASKLSLGDDFLQYEPQTEAQEGFKKNLTSAIKSGVKDFYRPIYDPSVDENGNIVFVAGKKPAVGHSYN